MEFTMEELKDIMGEMLEEYAAGSADVENCKGVTLDQWQSCVEDFLLFVENSAE